MTFWSIRKWQIRLDIFKKVGKSDFFSSPYSNHEIRKVGFPDSRICPYSNRPNPGNTQPFSPPNIVDASVVTTITLYVTIGLGKIRISSVWIGNVATSGCRQGRKSNLSGCREYFSNTVYHRNHNYFFYGYHEHILSISKMGLSPSKTGSHGYQYILVVGAFSAFLFGMKIMQSVGANNDVCINVDDACVQWYCLVSHYMTSHCN